MLFKAELVGGSPWGFRLEDGITAEDRGQVRIAKMNGNSKAHSQGVQVGDIVHRINGQSVSGMSSSQVMQIVRSAGDVLFLELIRGHHSSQGDDVSSSGISSSDSLFHVSHTLPVSANHDTNSTSSRSSLSSPFADKTNRLSTFGQKSGKSVYRPVSFDVPAGDTMSREEENVNTIAPKSLFASEFTLDHTHDHKYNSDSQKPMTSNSGSTNLIENSAFSSANTVDNETSLNRWNIEKDRPHDSSGSMRPTSHSMEFDYSIPSISSTSNTTNSHSSVSSLNANISDSLSSRLPVVKNPTITLLQKKRAEGLLSRSLSSFENEASSEGYSNTSKPTYELSSSDVKLSSESPLTEDHSNSTDRWKEWKEDRFLNRGNQMEERFSQSGITVLSRTDDNHDKLDKHSNAVNDFQNSRVHIFARENWNQSPSEASLQEEVQIHSRPGNKYTGPGVANSHTVEVPSEKKYVKFEGVGPVDEKSGILIATRSSLDEKGQKDWYKQMYKSLHKSDKDSESVYVFPGDDGEPSSTDRTRRKSTHGVTYTIRKATPDDKGIGSQRYASTPSLADAGLEDKSPSSSSSKAPGAKDHRLSVSSAVASSKGRLTSTSSSPGRKLSESWTPAQYKYESQPYKVQPKRIEDYEPGQSSVLQKDGRQAYSSIGNLCKDEVYIKPSRRSESREDTDIVHLNERPFWKSTSELDRGSLGHLQRDSKQQKPANETKLYNSNGSKTSTSKTNGDNWDRDVNGFRAFQSKDRNVSRESNSRQSSSFNSTSALNSRGTRDLPSTTVQRSTHDLKLQNSHQGDSRVSAVQPTVRSDVTQPISLAKAIYSLRAQSPSDLSFQEGDAIYILDKIDDNWYKGECNGKVGKFPINFVERQTSAEGEYLPETSVFGRGRALYDFTAQTLLELSFKKNDELALISRVNKDWFEACIGKRKGFVPANYVEVIIEPSLLSSPKKVLSPQETTRPSLISTSSLSTSNLTLSPAVHQNVSQRQNSWLKNDSFNGSQRVLEKNAIHQRGSSMGSDMQNKNSAQLSSLASHQPANRFSQSEMNLRESFRSTDRLNNDHLRPTSASVNGPGKASIPSRNVANQPMQRSYDRAPASGIAGTIAGGTKVVPVKTATVWPTHKRLEGDKIQAPSSQNFGKARHVALFAYNPRRQDELELNKGDIVYVMEQYDDGWFVGMSERTKKLGTFPGNYVEAI